MKTTLNFDDRLIRAAKARTAHDGDTLTGLIERALRDYLRVPRAPKRSLRAELPTRRGRPVAGLDLDDRNILHERMDGCA
ncbi:MAG: type II toxin-antitoxin system VapB family antitoxin [Alphaproteobacteria bacterium]|nr:type II toxin-antitoxin system VapB family antitoxin [Alphaproteobacteria bacterium]